VITPQEGHNKIPNLKHNVNRNKEKEKTFSVTDMHNELEVVSTGDKNRLVDEVFIGSPPPPQAPDTSAVKHEFLIQYERIRAARQSWKRVPTLARVGPFSWAAVSRSRNMVYGSFAVPDINRQYTVTNIHSLSDKKKHLPGV
jgi:hypothetical protein